MSFDKVDGAIIHIALLPVTERLSGIPVFIRKGYFSVFKRQEAIVGNGNPVGIAREVFEHIFRLLNGVSDIYYPVASKVKLRGGSRQ